VLSAPLLALAITVSAQAADPVDMGEAHDYSVLADVLTSNGPTAMSDNLGTFPATTIAGDTAPIVLGEQHLGDADAQAAKHSMDLAYADAMVRVSTAALPANLGGATLTPGVHSTSGAMGFTASTVLTLDGQGDRDAVFIFQIGAALTVGASAQVNLVGDAQACNVFWAVGGATSIGATAKFAGTILGQGGAVGVGAGSRVDGRVLGPGAVTVASTAIRTACTETIVVPGPVGPAGADGADGADGAQGIQGATGPPGAQGVDGTDGQDGLPGTAGPMGPIGPLGPTGLMGPTGPAPTATTTALCVSNAATRPQVRRGQLVGWTIVVKNCGDSAASNVVVTDRLPAGATVSTRGGGTLVGRELSWKLASLAPGAGRTFRITSRVSRTARTAPHVNLATAEGANTGLATGHASTAVVSGAAR
jgi:uncharacterized repeat protein (TIGR01451 family)